jgi:hypothetical protein
MGVETKNMDKEVMQNKSKEILKSFDGWSYHNLLITLVMTLLIAIDFSKRPNGTLKFVMDFMTKYVKE